MKHLHLQGISRKTENKIGKIIIDGLKKSNQEIDDDSVAHVLDVIKNRLCTANAIPPGAITIHLIHNDQVNAFSLPGHHILIYTGLINHCDSVSELCGVISHEMGHIQLNHVMKRLVNEIGITVLASVASNGNSQVVGKIIQILSSSAFERKQESDADAAGVRYLEHAHINPKGFVNIMLKFADIQSEVPSEMEWISSHPDSKKRAAIIQSLIDTNSVNYVPVIDINDWQLLKDASEDHN